MVVLGHVEAGPSRVWRRSPGLQVSDALVRLGAGYAAAGRAASRARSRTRQWRRWNRLVCAGRRGHWMRSRLIAWAPVSSPDHGRTRDDRNCHRIECGVARAFRRTRNGPFHDLRLFRRCVRRDGRLRLPGHDRRSWCRQSGVVSSSTTARCLTPFGQPQGSSSSHSPARTRSNTARPLSSSSAWRSSSRRLARSFSASTSLRSTPRSLRCKAVTARLM